MFRLSVLVAMLVMIGGCSTKVDPPVVKEVKPAAKVVKKVQIKHEPVRFNPSSAGQWKGFNAMQTSKVAWDSSQAKISLLNMAAVGANAVALIPFMKQSSIHATDIRLANNVTIPQLTAAIEAAHKAGLKVVVKPQILIPGGWAGDISFSNETQRNLWFKNYSEHLLMYARLSQQLGVEAFVIGTELKKVAKDLPWLPLIAQLRREFRGKLTYAAHNVDGVEKFPYWYKLDVTGVSYYPPLGDMGEYDEMLAHVELALYKLNRVVKEHRNKSVWLLEIGVPSASGASSQPWEWRSLEKRTQRPDLTMQTGAVAAWLNVIQRSKNVKGVFFWNWFSDPYAGGESDIDYTVQNKPAEIMIRQYWNN
ncbi:hypothetical protein MMIC_P0501 [Mariprofundus micogutta]|uniref:GTA TIM-barrel-like domain-containing protein n=1 Tax=Mariprofundus micogutta TaxID=1921010 RepID=A0A1L8CKW6_9PROT|nr:hypothetical protein [Mariprofundus micogutta]GAV19554.1 hypothetical protein MMIC_P0501 [Mariprofundus micogutta]